MSSWLGFGLIDTNSGYEYLTSWLSSTSVLGMSILGESIYEMVDGSNGVGRLWVDSSNG